MRGICEGTLLEFGVRRLAQALAGMGGDEVRQLAQRLPLAIGQQLLAALRVARSATAAPEVDQVELAEFAEQLAQS
jgi:hypothetical protein